MHVVTPSPPPPSPFYPLFLQASSPSFLEILLFSLSTHASLTLTLPAGMAHVPSGIFHDRSILVSGFPSSSSSTSPLPRGLLRCLARGTSLSPLCHGETVETQARIPQYHKQ